MSSSQMSPAGQRLSKIVDQPMNIAVARHVWEREKLIIVYINES